MNENPPNRLGDALSEDAFEALLQDALEPVATAQPTPEFQQRLLAASRFAPIADTPRIAVTPWRFAAGLAVAAALLVVLATYEVSYSAKISGDAVTKALPPSTAHLPLQRSFPQREIKAPVASGGGSATPTRTAVALITKRSFAAAEEPLPKLDTFPSPDLVAEEALRPRAHERVPLLSGDAGQAQLALEEQQAEPLIIAQIHISPLSPTEKDTSQ